MVLTKIEFQMVQFWVQIHDIGLKKFNEANVENTGNKIGKFIETEKEPEKTITCYLKIKVQVDANQSLLDGFWWTNSEGKENWDRSSMKGYRTSSMDVACLEIPRKGAKEKFRCQRKSQGIQWVVSG